MEKLTTCGPSSQHQAHASPGAMTEGSGANSTSRASQMGMPLAGPRTPPDQASIQSSMDKNKETLKRKLMLRRSVNELVDRGIYPPLKTPPAFAEKTKQLERAKTGDLLRHKIQHRPDRQLLVQQHILEDTTIDPSLHERQRLLKRSRLLDGLNDKLAHRPGPLELVQGNILQPSRELANAVKDGTIQFVPTCDSEDMDQSGSSFMFDDESTGSDGAPSPSMDESSGLSDISSPSSAPPVPSAESLPISFTFTKSIPLSLSTNKGPQIPLVCSSSAIVAAPATVPKVSTNLTGTSSGRSTPSISNNNNSKFRSKKPKPKATSKARIIKFHEYKGPPSVVKSQSTNTAPAACNSSTEDTPYHIMLQQQQLFLQWQLEFQQRQHPGSALSPGAVAAALGENSTSPVVSSIMVTSPVALATTSPTLVQPAMPGNAGLVQPVSLHQVPTSSVPATTQAVLSPMSVTAQITTQAAPQSSPVAPAPPPPPPPQPSRPTQTVIPRQLTKALTSIPATALSLPKLSGNLEEMKVADLKAELKKRSLPVSGPKPQLIERLKPFTESSNVPPSPLSKSNSRPPSRVSTPQQFSQTTFHIKTEPNGDVTACPVTRPIPSMATTSLLNSSSSDGASSASSAFPLPITLPLGTQGVKTIVSVKPMIKEEPMATSDISPPITPPILLAPTPGPITPMSPDNEATSPPNLISKFAPPAITIPQTLLKTTNNKLLLSGSQNSSSAVPGQTVVSMNTDTSRPASVVPAEMMPMEVDSVSVDLNQGVDDTAFKAASLGHSLDSASFKALVQHPVTGNCYKTISLSQNALDNSTIKTVSINANGVDANTIKTINLSPNMDGTATIKTINISPSTDPTTIKTINLSPHLDGTATIKTVNISPNTDPATIKTINLGSSSDGSQLKTLNVSQAADASGFKTVSVSPMGDATSLLKTIKVPLSQLSPTPVSPVQLTAPLTHTVTSPTSLLQLQQLQQLQTLQQLQQQLLQQTQAQQQAATIQLTTSDQVVLAQAKQIEELQRQLQESHLKLKLQQLQQLQLQQQQQQQQQQLWQVRIPSNFAQNSLLTKLSQDQLTITPQVVSTSLQVQPQSNLITQQPTATVVQQQKQQQSGSVFLNGQAIQQTPLVVSGGQQGQIQHQPVQAPVIISNQALVNTSVSAAGTVSSDSGLFSMAGDTSGQTTVSLPCAIHINLTSSGQVKLPPQLQPVTSSAIATPATATKQPSLPSLQLPAQLLLNSTSAGLIAAQPIKSEPSTPHPIGPQSTTSVSKSQATSGQSFVFTASPTSTTLVPGYTNGVILRTTSVPTSSVATDQQKLGVHRCSSSPYFSGPLKEPPRYDEAIKIKQQQTVNTSGNNSVITSSHNSLNKALSLGHLVSDLKSQTMDDVLEILIRNGDLPPSAATEPLPIPKPIQVTTTPQTNAVTTCTTSQSSLSVTPSPSPVFAAAQSPSPPLMPALTPTMRTASGHHRNQASMCTSNPRDQILTSVHTSMFSESMLNDTHLSSPQNPDTSGSSSLGLNDGTSNSDGELLDWGEMLASPDLSNMDWTTESGFGHIDLGDSNLSVDSKMCDSINPSQNKSRLLGGVLGLDPVCTNTMSGSSCLSDSNNPTGLRTPSVHGSEPDLTAFGLGGDSSSAVDPASQMDMSEWLDVIMPRINLEPLSVPASIPFSADPILTPHTRQDVFDIFNFDDPDFGPSAMSWEKLTEQGTSS